MCSPVWMNHYGQEHVTGYPAWVTCHPCDRWEWVCYQKAGGGRNGNTDMDSGGIAEANGHPNLCPLQWWPPTFSPSQSASLEKDHLNGLFHIPVSFFRGVQVIFYTDGRVGLSSSANHFIHGCTSASLSAKWGWLSLPNFPYSAMWGPTELMDVKICFRKNKGPYLQTQDVFIDLFMLFCVLKKDLR